jgi:hypothetical protein
MSQGHKPDWLVKSARKQINYTHSLTHSLSYLPLLNLQYKTRTFRWYCEDNTSRMKHTRSMRRRSWCWPLICCCTHSLTHSLTHSFNHTRTHSLTDTSPPLSAHSSFSTPTRQLLNNTSSLAQHRPTHSLTHSLTHFLSAELVNEQNFFKAWMRYLHVGQIIWETRAPVGK